jgi:exodeoxyribonuclease VII large subunit
MKSLFEIDEPVLTVSEFLDALNQMIGGESALVSGEVAEFRSSPQWTSFSLKDPEGGAVLKCVCAAWKYKKLGVALEDGMQVKAGGRPRVTKSYGSLGFWVESVEPVGEGSLKRAYELLKKKLEAEGVFARKRPLPAYVQNVGLISSKGGVVIHDFMKNLAPRGIKVNFADSRVEGALAARGIIRAIKWFNANMPELDALVVARGGGGLESMQAFNNEEVCRAIFASRIAVICGIGHEVDVPLACLAADVSCSTPTAAAVAVSQTWEPLARHLPLLRQKIFFAFENLLARFRDLQKSIIGNFENMLAGTKDRVAELKKLIAFADPRRNLKLGYSIALDAKGKAVRSVSQVGKGDEMVTILLDGKIRSKVV